MNTEQTSKHTNKQHCGGQSVGLPFHSGFVGILNKPTVHTLVKSMAIHTQWATHSMYV